MTKSVNKSILALLGISTMSLLVGCNNKIMTKVTFELEGGSFPANFGTTVLEGEAGSRIEVDIPNPIKEGYYFVGWREKKSDGTFRRVSKQLGEDGKYYFNYPYVDDTLYAYYEKLVTISFDLTAATDREGALVAPLFGADSFVNDTLQGYSNKEIPSLDYLPTATGDHLNFEYWYTEYPLQKITDANNETHYYLNTEAEKGVYKFDTKAFEDGTMMFPTPNDEGTNITLYAQWTEDPTIKVHYNLDGIDVAVFQTTEKTFSEDLINQIKVDIGVDFASLEDDYYYYPLDTKAKRFDGFYLDPEFKNPIYLDSSIMNKDLDIYLKWQNRISVTLDYNGGTLNGETNSVIDHYYEGDVLGVDFYDQHKPAKENATFRYFEYNGKEFNFSSTLPSTDIVLKAVYDDFPILTLTYDYPDNFVGQKLEDVNLPLEPATDFLPYMNSFVETIENDAAFIAENLTVIDYYILDENGSELQNLISHMPEEDYHLYLKLNYKTELSVITYANTAADGSYEEVKSSEIKMYFDSSDNVVLESFGPSFISEMVLSSETYLYDGLYMSNQFSTSQEVAFPLSFDTSHVERITKTIYRRYTKAIELTFVTVDETGTPIGEESKILKVIPGSSLIRYQEEIEKLVGAYSRMYIKDGESAIDIVSKLPSVNSTIYVVK